jgi:hypothetical protein
MTSLRPGEYAGQEADIGTRSNGDFASLLDDLLLEHQEEDQHLAPRVGIPFDYLSVADELHSGRIKVSESVAGAEYRRSGEGFEAGFGALLGDAAAPAASPEVETDDFAPVEPEALARELGLGTVGAADLGRLRRNFALKNHPDRVAPHLRQRALARMQMANRLIDEAKRRAIAKPKG